MEETLPRAYYCYFGVFQSLFFNWIFKMARNVPDALSLMMFLSTTWHKLQKVNTDLQKIPRKHSFHCHTRLFLNIISLNSRHHSFFLRKIKIKKGFVCIIWSGKTGRFYHNILAFSCKK